MAGGDDGVPVDLRADGVLWLINRSVFHPRGFALAVDTVDNLSLMGDGRERWAFDPTIPEDDLFAAVEALFQRAREANC